MQQSLKNNSSYLFASRDGVICRNDGTVIAGNAKKEKAGILQRKQQIEKLTMILKNMELEYTQIISDKDICIINRDEAKVALIEVDEKLNKGQRQQQEQQTNIKHYENGNSKYTNRIQIIPSEIGKYFY